MHVGTHGNVTGYELSLSDNNGAGILLMDDDADDQTSNGEVLGFIGFDASDNRSTLNASAVIAVSASVDHSSSAKGADIGFSTKSNTAGPSDGATQRMIITHDGNIGINTGVGGFGGPTSTLHTNGSVAYAVDNFTATSLNSYNLDEDNYLLLANTASSSAVINLPAASTCEGRVYHVIKTSPVNSLIFSSNIHTGPSTTANTFSGANVQLRIISAGGQWRILEVRY